MRRLWASAEILLDTCSHAVVVFFPFALRLSIAVVCVLSLGMPWYPVADHDHCAACNTIVRPNYRVRNAQSPDAKRIYEEGVPNMLEVTEHTYVEKDLAGLFRAQMAFGQ